MIAWNRSLVKVTRRSPSIWKMPTGSASASRISSCFRAELLFDADLLGRHLIDEAHDDGPVEVGEMVLVHALDPAPTAVLGLVAAAPRTRPAPGAAIMSNHAATALGWSSGWMNTVDGCPIRSSCAHPRISAIGPSTSRMSAASLRTMRHVGAAASGSAAELICELRHLSAPAQGPIRRGRLPDSTRARRPPPVTTWPLFPFEGEMRVKPLGPLMAAEMPPRRRGRSAVCAVRDPDAGVIWSNERWTVSEGPRARARSPCSSRRERTSTSTVSPMPWQPSSASSSCASKPRSARCPTSAGCTCTAGPTAARTSTSGSWRGERVSWRCTGGATCCGRRCCRRSLRSCTNETSRSCARPWRGPGISARTVCRPRLSTGRVARGRCRTRTRWPGRGRAGRAW